VTAPGTNDASALESVLRRDRLVVLVGLAGVTTLAWIYLVVLSARMGGMPGTMEGVTDMLRLKPWSAIDFLLMFLMWAVMMVGMMVPSAAPMILLYTRLVRRERSRGRPLASVGTFFVGYIAVWTGFSLAATALQWVLERLALLSPMMVSSSAWLGGLLLIAAGVYQLSPAKQACLQHCRSPLEFLSTRWRPGARGAFAMGLEHGAFCVGCCWVLMALLFVGGVMNLLWVAAITLFVLIEKVAPWGALTGRVASALLCVAGLLVIVQAPAWT
jgi:predicted metal-binding membrane protein